MKYRLTPQPDFGYLADALFELAISGRIDEALDWCIWFTNFHIRHNVVYPLDFFRCSNRLYNALLELSHAVEEARLHSENEDEKIQRTKPITFSVDQFVKLLDPRVRDEFYIFENQDQYYDRHYKRML